MYISVRIRVVAATILLTVVYTLSKVDALNFSPVINNDLLTYLLKSLVIGILAYVLALWVVSFKATGIKKVTVLLMPALSLFLFTLFSELSLYQIFGLKTALIIVFLVIIFATYCYFLLLNANLLNLAHFENIPLLKAAITANYIFSILDIYIFSIIIFSLNISIELRFIILLVLTFFFSFQSCWPAYNRLKDSVRMALAFAMFIILLAASLLLWPIPVELIALFISAFAYVFLGLALEKNEKIYKGLYFEYLLVIAIVAIFCIASANFGINGSIFNLPF